MIACNVWKSSEQGVKKAHEPVQETTKDGSLAGFVIVRGVI